MVLTCLPDVVACLRSTGERRSRRGLVYDDAGNGALRGGGTGRGSNRLLANDCESQMWILTDPDAMVDGFPYCE